MKLRKKIDYIKFLNSINECEEDVFFCTTEGDRINLKSMLSKYLFSAIIGNSELISQGQVECKAEADYEKLKEFLEE